VRKPFVRANPRALDASLAAGAALRSSRAGAMSRKTEGDADVVVQEKVKAKKPSLYKVLLHNDDYTTMEFVVWLLTTVFHHDQQHAHQIMMHVHKKGVGVAGVYTREVAETKVQKTIQLARSHEFPLECTMEPE
jgi:ATP-dependent Clp protease adaptor protein ClpS